MTNIIEEQLAYACAALREELLNEKRSVEYWYKADTENKIAIKQLQEALEKHKSNDLLPWGEEKTS